MTHAAGSPQTLTIYFFSIRDKAKYAPRLPRDFSATSEEKVGIGRLKAFKLRRMLVIYASFVCRPNTAPHPTANSQPV
jgi:hypothetical protein